MKKRIHFTVLENTIKHSIETYEGEYRNLMFLLKDKVYLDSFGECGGNGRCATCIIKISGLSGNSTKKERNEPVTLSKMGYLDGKMRLACQILITNDLNEVVIELL